MAPADRVVAEEAIMAEVEPVKGEYVPEIHSELPEKEEVKEVKKGKK